MSACFALRRLNLYQRGMKPFRYAVLVLLPFLAIVAPSHASPARFAAPAAEFHPAQVRAVCHHYRWSSRRACTNANTLRFVARPPLYYPHKYFGGTPHYARRLYQHDYAMSYYRYRSHYWHHWPYRYGWY